MRERKYELLLASVIAARATSFIFSKMILETMEMFNLMAVRFLSAFFLLFIVFFKKMTHIKFREILSGVIIGTLFVLVMACELAALKITESSTVSLLENCSVIFVPFFEAALIKRLPDKTALLCAATAMLGIFCLTAQVGSLSRGMILALLAAVLYATAIIVTGKISHSASDPLAIGIAQVGAIGVLSLVLSFIFETPHMPSGGSQWIMILILSVVCTGFGFTLQPVAQSRVSVERAGLLCAVNPAIAAVLGTVVLHEPFGFMKAAGLLLILSGIALPYVKLPEKIKKS